MSHFMKTISMEYEKYSRQLFTKGLTLKLAVMIALLIWFLFSDIYFRENIVAAYARVIPILLAATVLFLSVINGVSRKLISMLYHIFLFSGLLMMFGKCIIHFNDGLASSVSGTILVIFLVSLEIRLKWFRALLFFISPVILFGLLLLFIPDIAKEQLMTLSNILPMLILGFVVNRVQENLRYKNFEQQWLLIKEKELTEMQALALLESEAKFRKLNDTKDRFFSIIGHDLRSPYNALLGYSKLLIKECRSMDFEEIEQISNQIYSSANHNCNLLNNLLQWSMVHQKGMIFSPINTKLEDIITQIELLFNPMLCKKDITLINNSPEGLAFKADALMLETILRNLVSNAIKFTSKGGLIEIGAQQTAAHTKITVSDNGVGIAEEDRGKLFSIDKQLRTKGTDDELGTGLGLVICKEFMDYHQGTIAVEPNCGMGTCFCLTIPQVN